MSETFSPWEHLQSTIINSYNKIVRDEFNDVTDDDGISTPRSSLKVACLAVDSDTAAMTACRMLMFYMTCRKAQDMQRPIYGIPSGTFDELRKYRPQITLHFAESIQDVDVEASFQPIYGQCSVRLMSESSTTITEAELRSYANKIKSVFGAGNGYIWKKGRGMLSYNDAANGVKLQINCTTEAVGRSLAENVLDVIGQTPDWQNANYKENLEAAQAYPSNPGQQTILGKPRNKPRIRPIADVRFRYATCSIHGLPNPIILYDKTGRYRNAILNDF